MNEINKVVCFKLLFNFWVKMMESEAIYKSKFNDPDMSFKRHL